MNFVLVYIIVVSVCIIEAYFTTRYDDEFEDEINKRK